MVTSTPSQSSATDSQQLAKESLTGKPLQLLVNTQCLSASDTAAGLSQAMAASELTSEIHCNLENVGASFFTQAPVPSSSPRSDRHNPW